LGAAEAVISLGIINMASFFEKLKKGMGVEGDEKMEETKEEEIKETENEGEKEKEESKEEEKEVIVEKPKKRMRQKIVKTKEEENPVKKEEEKEVIEKKEASKPAVQKNSENKEGWSNLNKEPEGQLAIDVYQTETELVLQSAIAGVKPESLDITIEGDMVTVRGNREKPQEEGETNYFYQECFWGPFSRQIILSVEVDPSRTEASLKDGILTVRIPKIERERKRKIAVKG
jgi:HSP20 family protein